MTFLGLVGLLAYWGDWSLSPAPSKAVAYFARAVQPQALTLIERHISPAASRAIAHSPLTPATSVTLPTSSLNVANLSGVPKSNYPFNPVTRLPTPLDWLQPTQSLVPPPPPPITVSLRYEPPIAAPDQASLSSLEPNRESCGACGQQSERPSPLFQVLVQGQAIATALTQSEADAIAWRLQQVLQNPEFDPNTLYAEMVHGIVTGNAGQNVLFWVDPTLALRLNQSRELMAIDWINNLRTILNAPSLSLVEAQTHLYGLVSTGKRLRGTASWYGPYFHGNLTAAGETFDQTELTAAHPTLPFDTYLNVINIETGNSVIVRINDRGPYFDDRSLDLSREAARSLNSEISGVVPYEAVIMRPQPEIVQSNAESSPAALVAEPAPAAASDELGSTSSALTSTP